jgi:hypothetical protein
LEKVGGCQRIFPVAVEIDWTLHALKRVRAEDLYQFGIVNTLRFVNGLIQHLQYRVRLDLVPTNVDGGAAEPGDVLLLELYILKGREAWEPAAIGDASPPAVTEYRL